jgi:hypothetical protein
LNAGTAIEYQLIPMSVLVNELVDEGFNLERLVEPRPHPSLRTIEPDRFDELSAAPIFVALRLHR